MNITFNPIYSFKKDEGKVWLLHTGGLNLVEEQINDSFCGIIHPLHAIILSFINGDDYDETIKRIKSFIDVKTEYIIKFIDGLLENDTNVVMNYKGFPITFPARTIIKSSRKRNNTYNPESFLFDNVDLRMKRPSSVSRLTFMLNNKCLTNCYYCYADKRNPTDCKIPIERYKEIIEEAYRLGVVSIDLIGGEILLYRNWKELVKELKKYYYNPLISTKVPIQENDVKFLHDVGVSCIQISLDSFIPEKLKELLRVDYGYADRMRKSFEMLAKYGIKVAVHSIVTQKNSEFENFSSIYDFIKDFDNILYWRTDKAGESIYVRQDVAGTIKPTDESIEKLIPCFESLFSSATLPVVYSGLNISEENDDIPFENKWQSFCSRGLCSGNFFNLFVLPDGKVTICEELYWHPNFIIGDVNKQSLHEIWTSDDALSLFNIKKERFSEESHCRNCEEFDFCRSVKQVCYRDIIRKYGMEHWDYPDVKCPYSK